MAVALEAAGVRTAAGCSQWSPTQVARVLHRLEMSQ
jgi:hypothetical protein